MKKVATLFAALAITLCASEINASPVEGQKGEGRAAGKARDGKPGAAREGRPGGGREGRPGAGRGTRGGDATQMVARIMKQFDKDGDEKLDMKELTAMMTAMRERRMGQGGQMQRPGQDGQKGQGGRKGAGRKRGGDEGKEAGGKTPKRPSDS